MEYTGAHTIAAGRDLPSFPSGPFCRVRLYHGVSPCALPMGTAVGVLGLKNIIGGAEATMWTQSLWAWCLLGLVPCDSFSALYLETARAGRAARPLLLRYGHRKWEGGLLGSRQPKKQKCQAQAGDSLCIVAPSGVTWAHAAGLESCRLPGGGWLLLG